MANHHGARPDLADRIGDALARDVRGRTMDRLEHRGILALRVDVARRRHADRAGERRAEVGEDVAEQVGADHHVEPVRVAHEMRRQDVDVILVRLDVRVLLAHLGEALVPEWHGVDDAVRLGGRGHVLLLRRAGEVEGELEDTVDALAGEDRLLNGHLVVGTLEHAAADRAVLALGVLAHDPEIDVARLAVGQGRRHALEQTHRPQVHIFVEVATDRDQQSPQGNVIGHARPAHGAQEDALERLELLHAVVRHHLAGLHQPIARPVEIGEFEFEVEAPRGGFENEYAFRQNFLTDSVTRN